MFDPEDWLSRRKFFFFYVSLVSSFNEEILLKFIPFICWKSSERVIYARQGVDLIYPEINSIFIARDEMLYSKSIIKMIK